jgi:2-dehydro-3-deoxyphosphooctonate aldolase (KDO 8-P synthase)
MTNETREIAAGISAGSSAPLFLIAGPCVIESEKMIIEIAGSLKTIAGKLNIPLVFKASFDKANRSSIESFRGPGLKEGLRILRRVKEELELPVLTDFHEPGQAAVVAEAADVLQVPAFLCRQTDMLLAAAQTGRTVNVKKGQFLSPWDVKNIIGKIRSVADVPVLLTERGASFGYRNLVVDMKGIPIMRDFGAAVVFDATHSVQLPGGLGDASGGMREFVPTLAKAAVAAGADGLFMEVHPEPDSALSDGPNMWPLEKLENLLVEVRAIAQVVRNRS